MLLTACQSPRSPTTRAEFVRRSQPLLGTFVVVAAYGTSRAQLDAAITGAFDEVKRVDALMSIHRADSELSGVNSTAASSRAKVSNDLFQVVTLALSIARESDGSFDPTIRPLTDLWGFIWKEYRLPTETELAAVLPRVNHRFVKLDEREQTIRFTTNGVSLDLGGIAKGYAVDRAIRRLQSHGISNALVRAGGDLRVIGAPPGKSAWDVQLEDPSKSGKRTTIQLRDAAVSTSGNYENFFVVDGRRYSHILNPHTGLPVEGVVACSVVAPTCVEADGWSTALFVLGPERSLGGFTNRFGFRFVLPREKDGLRTVQSRFPVSATR